MNPRSATVRQSEYPTVAGRVEHITLGGEPDGLDAPAKQPHRGTLRRYSLASPQHGCITELSLLEGNFLDVRCVRRGTEPCRYQLDLRFANAKPVRVRHVPWLGLGVGAGLAVLGGGMLATAWSAGHAVLGLDVIGGIVATFVGILAVRTSVGRTTESLQLRSLHGGATLVSVTGRVGSTNRDKSFFEELARSIEASRTERAQQRRQFLCDEMREHHRLHQLGILGDREYEASKARILAAH